eukprot:snap_masked-scaffold_1-processed-gene-6.37-mRNA-1 protein AED:1.00 eAED:1.00 QI:0/0/0/0/1/1/2/0/63
MFEQVLKRFELILSRRWQTECSEGFCYIGVLDGVDPRSGSREVYQQGFDWFLGQDVDSGYLGV